MAIQDIICAVAYIQTNDHSRSQSLQSVIDDLRGNRIKIAEQLWYEILLSNPNWSEAVWQQAEQVTSAFQTYELDVTEESNEAECATGDSTLGIDHQRIGKTKSGMKWFFLFLSLVTFTFFLAAFFQAASPTIQLILLGLSVSCALFYRQIDRIRASDRRYMAGKVGDKLIEKIFESLFR